MRPGTVILFFVLFCLGFATSSQATSDPEVLIAKAASLTGSDPFRAIKIGEHLSRLALSERQRCDVALVLARSYYHTGQLGPSLTATFQAKTLAQHLEARDEQITSNLLIATLLNDLQLDDQSAKYLDLVASEVTAGEPTAVRTHLQLGYLNLKAQLASERADYAGALRILSQARKVQGRLPQENREDLAEIELTTGKIDLAQKRFGQALERFSQGLNLLQGSDRNVLVGLRLSNEKAQANFQLKRHQQAIAELSGSLRPSGKLRHERIQESINRQLALNHLALNNLGLYRQYTDVYRTFDDRADIRESEATNIAYNLVSRDQETASGATKDRYARVTYTLMALAVGAGLCLLFLYMRQSARITQYREVHDFLVRDKQTLPLERPARKRELSKGLVIPAETEQSLLAKLMKFESSTRFTNKDMSLAMLATQFDTNTKYLSEIINRHSGENFNTYINKLRIAYIIDKLRKEPKYRHYKIRYLADECGFSSHSAFATTFKSIAGISPTTFIELVSEQAPNNTADS